MTKFSTYAEALQFLYDQLPMYQRVGKKAFKPGLDNIHRLLDRLDTPQGQFASIHIAGTNGKGSTTHMLGAIFAASGRRVGLYTSPHYADFRERIKINADLIPEAAVLEFLNAYYPLIEEIRPSYFELTVALAFWYFARQEVDIAVIETGLGGRLDSTNVIQPLLSVITNIGYDHMDVLGETLALIAAEKAGIIKYQTPVVVGHKHPETVEVFRRKAAEMEAPLTFVEDRWKVHIRAFDHGQMLVDIDREGKPFRTGLRVDASGQYQAQNLQTVLETVEALRPRLDISQQAIIEGLRNLRRLTYFIGRWQILGEQPLIIADSAHNAEAIELAMEQLRTYEAAQLHLVIGMARDKDHNRILALFPPEARYYFARPDVPRGLEAVKLREKAAAFGLSGEIYPSVPEALAAARLAAVAEDLIFVGGSSFTVAEVVPATY